MTVNTVSASQRQAALIAGFSLPFALVLVVFANFYIGANLIVPGNAVDTANNILAHQTRFHVWVACDLLYAINVVAISAALYVILKPANHSIALAAAFCRAIYSVMWVTISLNMLSAFTLLCDTPYLHVIEADHLQALARAHLHGSFDAYYVGLPFWAMASTICSILWLKSKYIPRVLASFGVIASAWCLFCAFAFLAWPQFSEPINVWLFDMPMAIFEMATGIWLLVKGIRPSGAQSA
jgi:hypothetical protein